MVLPHGLFVLRFTRGMYDQQNSLLNRVRSTDGLLGVGT